MPDIVLTTLNAKYIHAAFGLRYLLANLGELRENACLIEFDINQKPLDIAEVILAQNPEDCRPWGLHLERHAGHGTGRGIKTHSP